jgi:hypothetical protein
MAAGSLNLVHDNCRWTVEVLRGSLRDYKVLSYQRCLLAACSWRIPEESAGRSARGAVVRFPTSILLVMIQLMKVGT